MKRPEHQHYDDIHTFFQKSIDSGSDFLFSQKRFDDEITRLWEQTNVPVDTLISFLRNLHTYHVKKMAPTVMASLKTSILPYYLQGRSLMELARDVNFPPFLLARYIIMEITNIPKKNVNKSIKSYALDNPQHMKHPHGPAEAKRLAHEVAHVLVQDPLYSPQHDIKRHCVGIEYETLLEHKLKQLNIPFESEKDLREKGNSKTPDICLLIPMAIRDDNSGEWRQIQWIDSKAMFGDVGTHRVSVLPQAETYLHRYGPGLIVYWFGHAPMERLDRAQGDVSICGWDLPDTFLLPTGKIIRRS